MGTTDTDRINRARAIINSQFDSMFAHGLVHPHAVLSARAVPTAHPARVNGVRTAAAASSAVSPPPPLVRIVPPAAASAGVGGSSAPVPAVASPKAVLSHPSAAAVACSCGSPMVGGAGTMVQCTARGCGTLQHRTCVNLARGPLLPTPPGYLCLTCRVRLADPFWLAEDALVLPASRLAPTGRTAVVGTSSEPVQTVDRHFNLFANQLDALRRGGGALRLHAYCLMLDDAVSRLPGDCTCACTLHRNVMLPRQRWLPCTLQTNISSVCIADTASTTCSAGSQGVCHTAWCNQGLTVHSYCRPPPQVPFRLHWPLQCELRINGTQVRPYSRSSSTKLGANQRDEAANITAHTASGRNRLTLTATDGRPFAVLLHLSRRQSVEAVKRMMLPALSLEQVRCRCCW